MYTEEQRKELALGPVWAIDQIPDHIVAIREMLAAPLPLGMYAPPHRSAISLS